MVRVPGQDCGRPVNLFEQHYADELMWPGRLAERQPQAGLLPEARGKAVSASYHEHRRRTPVLPPFAELGRKRAAVETFSARVEHHNGCVLRNDVGECDRFFE